MEPIRYFSLKPGYEPEYYLKKSEDNVNKLELRSRFLDFPVKTKEIITYNNGAQQILRVNKLRYGQVSQVPKGTDGFFEIYDNMKNADRIELSGTVKNGKIEKLKKVYLGASCAKNELIDKLKNLLKKCEQGNEHLAPQTVRYIKKSIEHLIK